MPRSLVEAYSDSFPLRVGVGFLVVLPTLFIPAFAQVLPPALTSLPAQLTLGQAIGIALAHQPQQYIAHAQVTQALGQRQQARSQYFPTVTPTYQFQNRRQTVFGLNSSASSTGNTVGTNTGITGTTFANQSVNEVSVARGGGLTVGVTQNIYDGGARETTNAEARRALDAANLNDANIRQDTILTVTQNFYQLLLALDLVKVAQAQVGRYQQTVAVTQAQIGAGTVPRKDIYQARADLANAQVALLQDQNQVMTASAALKNALGVNTRAVAQPAPLTANGGLPPLPASISVTTLDATLATAYVNRPDLQQQQAIVQNSNAALSQARREAGLSVRSDYVLTYQATNDVGNRGTTSQLLVTGSYPLFDAGNARGAVRIAQAQKDIAQDQLEQLRLQIQQNVEQAYATRAESLAAANLAQAAVTAAQVNFDAAVASRREGIGTVLDITTAQVTLTQAQNQYVTAVYNFYITDAQLLRAIGRNDVGYATAP